MKCQLCFLCLLVVVMLGAAGGATRRKQRKKYAAVTMATGDYVLGALALGQSLVDVGSEFDRIAIITPDTPQDLREALSRFWKIYEHEAIYCHVTDKSNLNDLGRYMQAPTTKNWLPTCTKFAAWKLIDYERVVFLDSDTLVVKPIDHVVWKYSNASFAAAPEIFPPDTFNSGFMVFTPSEDTFRHLLDLNDEIGSNDGGDQGVFNRGLCPHWYTADSTDAKCGRLPWIYNVEYHLFTLHHIYTTTTQQPLPAVLHYIGLKPWKVLQMDYAGTVDPSLKDRLIELADAHILWRDAFFRATGDTSPLPTTSLLYGMKLSTRTAIDYHIGGRGSAATSADNQDTNDSYDTGGNKGGGLEGTPQAPSRKRAKVRGKAKSKAKPGSKHSGNVAAKPKAAASPKARRRVMADHDL